MTVNTTAGRVLAIAALVAFTGGGLYILLEKALISGVWSMQHVLTVLIVFGTVASGHLSRDAVCDTRILTALGFALLFIAGTGLVVYNSVGRQTATSASQANEAVSHNELRDAILDRLEDERVGLKKANAKRDWEMAGRPDKKGNRTTKPICGGGCLSWKKIATEHRAQITSLEQRLADIGPPQTVNTKAKAQAFADVAAIFGFTKSATVAALTLLEPFAITLFFEIGIIVAAAFAFRHARVAETATVSVSKNGFQPPPRGAKPRLVPEARKLKLVTVHPVIDALNRGGPAASNDELAQRMGVSKGEASKRVREVKDRLDIHIDGRCKRIRLAG